MSSQIQHYREFLANIIEKVFIIYFGVAKIRIPYDYEI